MSLHPYAVRNLALHPYDSSTEGSSPSAKPAQHTSWTVPALCEAYSWPSGLPGTGPIAVFEAGGGWVESDMATFFGSIGQPVPTIVDIPLDSTSNTKQSPKSEADYEIALDIQVAAAAYFLATGKPATIHVYWSQSIAAAMTRAAADGCSVLSISWGDDEANWGAINCNVMEVAAAAATMSGMAIFAAAGDNDSSDGGQTPANVDAPGSCPHVVCCGGTSKTETAETVWNDSPGKTNGEGTGGGYSSIFPAQSWQIGAPPAPTKEQGVKSPGRGRMVPDVAACADPNNGILITVYGASVVIGGTSAVAPLFAGLFASFGEKLGFVAPKLWSNQGAFIDIISGSNGEFSAKVGPDPCSGIGAPIANKIATIFANPIVVATK